MDPTDIYCKWSRIARTGKLEETDADAFFRFIAMWIAFNALLGDKYPRTRDHCMVTRYAED